MRARLVLAFVTLAAGAGLLTAAFASAAPPSPGILKIGGTGDLDSIDPAIAYGTTAWTFEFATRANLFTYLDKPQAAGYKLLPEVAARFTVSHNGKVYRFFVKRSYRFSDGEQVTAGSFVYAIQRALIWNLGSPGGTFVTDRSGAYGGVEIVGAADYAAGHAGRISGVTANRGVLTIKLVRPAPNLLTILAMPFFQATSTKLPPTSEVVRVSQVGDLPTAGPYTWSFNDPNHQANIVRNPYYRGPRPHHLAGVEFDMRLRVDDCYSRTVSGDLDLGCIPATEIQSVADQYGVSRTRPVKTGRFWVTRRNCMAWLGFNYRRDLFLNNTPLRQAVNWALDRTALAAQLGPYGAPPTHLLPPGFPGSVSTRRLQPYSLRPNLEKARRLAAGHLRSGDIRVAYPGTRPALGDLVRNALVGLGFDSSRIQMIPYAGFNIEVIYVSDLVIPSFGSWCSDFPDPSQFLAQIFDVTSYGGSFFGSPSETYRKKVNAVSRNRTHARLRLFGKLDLAITKKLAPVAPVWAPTNLFFFGSRVDPSSLVYSPVYGWSFPALKLK